MNKKDSVNSFALFTEFFITAFDEKQTAYHAGNYFWFLNPVLKVKDKDLNLPVLPEANHLALYSRHLHAEYHFV